MPLGLHTLSPNTLHFSIFHFLPLSLPQTISISSPLNQLHLPLNLSPSLSCPTRLPVHLFPSPSFLTLSFPTSLVSPLISIPYFSLHSILTSITSLSATRFLPAIAASWGQSILNIPQYAALKKNKNHLL